MKAIAKRVAALEVDVGDVDGGKPIHLIGVKGEDYAAAVRKYREDHPDTTVDRDDSVIWLIHVEPNFDEEGKRIPPKERDDDSPSLADVLAELGEEQ